MIDKKEVHQYNVYQGVFEAGKVTEIYGYQVESLEWTTEPPTKPGLYKVFHENVKHIIDGGDWLSWEEIKEQAGRLYFLLTENHAELINEFIASEDDAGFVTHWLGPLPEPEPPAPCQPGQTVVE